MHTIALTTLLIVECRFTLFYRYLYTKTVVYKLQQITYSYKLKIVTVNGGGLLNTPLFTLLFEFEMFE